MPVECTNGSCQCKGTRPEDRQQARLSVALFPVVAKLRAKAIVGRFADMLQVQKPGLYGISRFAGTGSLCCPAAGTRGLPRCKAVQALHCPCFLRTSRATVWLGRAAALPP